MRVPIEVAPGELIDRLTILHIKRERIPDPEKLAHVARETRVLEAARLEHMKPVAAVGDLETRLKEVNEALWDIEDELRGLEAERRFDGEFVRLARAVYRTNDERAAIKRQINKAYDSDIAEVKSYKDTG